MTEAAEKEVPLPSDEQLAEMPLHTITNNYGYAGLSRRLELEIEKLPEESRALVGKAHGLAMSLHANDIRKSGEPANNHLLRVAIRIMHHYGVSDPVLIAAALLHDSVEDHSDMLAGKDNATPEEALAFLAIDIGADVASLVASVTNPDYDPSRDKLEQYHEHVTELLRSGNVRAKIIKVSDFTDNALGLKHLIKDDSDLPETVSYRANRYMPIVGEFQQAFSMPNDTIGEEVRLHILEQLKKTEALLTELVSQA